MEHLDLTKTEKKVAEIVGRGHSNAEVAQVLGVAVQTVKFHLTHIYKKNGFKNRGQLILALTKTAS